MTIIIFDRKGDFLDCRSLSQSRLPIIPLRSEEQQIAMLQPVSGLQATAFAIGMVAMLASHLSLIASRRLMLETLLPSYQRRRPKETWPTLSEWIETIEKIRVTSTSRLGQYREAVLYALGSLNLELGNVVNYAASDFFDKVFETDGCLVISSSGLSAEAASILASLYINWIFERRGLPGADMTRPVVFVLDDALSLVRGSLSSDAEGSSVNPLSSWAFLGRSRGIGFIVSAQNFSLMSPALTLNARTVLSFGSYGRDAEDLGRFMNLNTEQRTHILLRGCARKQHDTLAKMPRPN